MQLHSIWDYRGLVPASHNFDTDMFFNSSPAEAATTGSSYSDTSQPLSRVTGSGCGFGYLAKCPSTPDQEYQHQLGRKVYLGHALIILVLELRVQR